MKRTCIRDCTVPGHGLVVKGQKIDVPEGPWTKHFDGPQGGAEEVKAPKKAKGAKADGSVEDFLNS